MIFRFKRVALILLAILPIFISVTQLTHFYCWLFEYDSPLGLFKFSEAALILCFFVSILERFCAWYRLTILGTLYLNASCFFLDYFPSVLSYNITNFVAVAVTIAGIIGCLIHFGYQINDFIRYVKLKQRA